MLDTLEKLKDCSDEYFYMDREAVDGATQSAIYYGYIKNLTIGALIVLGIELIWMVCGNLPEDFFDWKAPYAGDIELKQTAEIQEAAAPVPEGNQKEGYEDETKT